MSNDFDQEPENADAILPPRRRRPRSRQSVYSRPVKKGRLLVTLLFVALLLVAGAAYRKNKITRYAIVVNNRVATVVGSKADARQVVAEVKESFAPGSPDAVTFKEGDLRIQPITKPARVSNRKQAVSLLKSRLTPIVKGAAIYVDRRLLVALPSREDAGRAIALMQKIGLGDQQGIPTIKQRVAIVNYTYTPKNSDGVSLMTPEQAAEFLVHPAEPRSYFVKSGDSFWSISNANGLTVDQIKELNPTVNPARLKKGDVIKLPSQACPVTIIVRSRAQ